MFLKFNSGISSLLDQEKVKRIDIISIYYI